MEAWKLFVDSINNITSLHKLNGTKNFVRFFKGNHPKIDLSDQKLKNLVQADLLIPLSIILSNSASCLTKLNLRWAERVHLVVSNWPFHVYATINFEHASIFIDCGFFLAVAPWKIQKRGSWPQVACHAYLALHFWKTLTFRESKICLFVISSLCFL